MQPKHLITNVNLKCQKEADEDGKFCVRSITETIISMVKQLDIRVQKDDDGVCGYSSKCDCNLGLLELKISRG